MNDSNKSAAKRQKDCNFITLHDVSMFKELKLPSSPTNHVLWYKKVAPFDWGLTIKRFDDKEEFSSQYTWKLTWIYNDVEEMLVPSKASTEFTDIIKGDMCTKLCEIKDKYINKKK